MLIQILSTIAALLVVATAATGAYKQHLENRVLKARLRRVLQDCRAFYELEDRLCHALAMAMYVDGSPNNPTALAIKRGAREALRRDGQLSPSAHATPHKIAEELSALQG